MISESDTDQELAQAINEEDFEYMYLTLSTGPERKRYYQIHRWNRGANSYIRSRLTKTRFRWARVFILYMGRNWKRRRTLLAIVHQQARLRSVRAVEEVIMRRLFRLFDNRLTRVQKMLVQQFLY